MNYNSDYDIRLKTLESLGGDVTRKYDSVYSIDLEILRLMEQGGGGGVVIQNYKGLITDPNTELIKSGDLGYNEVVEHIVKYSKYFTFLPNQRTLNLKIPSGISKTFLKVQKSVDVYSLYVNKLNVDGTYTWELIQENLEVLPALTKIPFTYIFYDETHSKNVEFNGEFAWSLDRQEIYYTSTIDGWTPELKMKGATEWNEGFYDISAPEVFTKKQKSFYVKDGDGNVINTNDINEKPKINSSKVVKISFDWYNNADNYQSNIKKALEDIYNEVSNNRTVTVMCNGFYSQPQESVLVTTNVIASNKNNVTVYFLGTEGHILRLSLIYEDGSDHYNCGAGDDKLPQKYDFNLPYIYKDGWMNLEANYGNVSEFISDPVIDNEEFLVLKTTVPYHSGEYPNNQIYKAFRDDYYNIYYLSKIAGMKLYQNESDANYDLIPDGEWYVIYCDYVNSDYGRIIITKAVRNVDNTLDVYLGFKNCFLENFGFWDCTLGDKNNQGNEGRWEEKGWTKVSDAQSISVDSFMARRTMFLYKNAEGVQTDRLTLFKRMK